MYRAHVLVAFASAVSIYDQQCSEGNCGTEQSVLLQSMNREGQQMRQATQVRQNRDSAGSSVVQELYQSAVNILRQGATPAIVSFTISTMASINETIIPAMLDSKREDQALVDIEHNKLSTIISNHNQRLPHLKDLENNIANASKLHKDCRASQLASCGGSTDCTIASENLKNRYEDALTAFEAIHGVIYTRKCIESRGDHCDLGDEDLFREKTCKKTVFVDRVTSSINFESYIKKGEAMFTAKEAFENGKGECEGKDSEKADWVSGCNTLQERLEEASCKAKAEHTKLREDLDTLWNAAAASWKLVEEDVVATESERKKAFTTIKIVECLLERIKEQGGKPCDTPADGKGTDKAIKNCHATHITTTHLDIDYSGPRDLITKKPKPPSAKPAACDEQFKKAEYGHLTENCFSDMRVCIVDCDTPVTTVPNTV